MNRIVVTMSVSLDGYFEGPDREIGWHKVDDELLAHMNEWLGKAGGFLDGRVTWQLMDDYWPTADQAPDATPLVVEFARIWREMPKVVYSRTLEHADWNTTIAREVVPEEVRALRDNATGDLVVGGADLAAEFRRHDLIDEYRVYVHPVVIGRGKPLFPEGTEPFDLQLTETKVFGNGVVLLRYSHA